MSIENNIVVSHDLIYFYLSFSSTQINHISFFLFIGLETNMVNIAQI